MGDGHGGKAPPGSLIPSVRAVEQLPNHFLRLFRLRSGLFAFGDRTAHHDVVGPVQERFFGGHGPFLIVPEGQIGKGPDTGCDDEKLAAQCCAQLGGFQAGGDDAVATQVQRPSGAGQDERLEVAGKTEIEKIIFVQAGQHRDGQKFGLSLDFHHRSEDVIVPMRREEGDTEAFDLGGGLLDRFGHVEKLDVGEDLFFALPQPVNEIEEIAGHEKLQTHFVKGDGTAQFIDEFLGQFAAGDIQRNDEPLGGRN